MIQKVSLPYAINFKKTEQSVSEPLKPDESTILPNTLKTRIIQKTDRIESAFTEYPVKGLLGHINSDFYQFLSMGAIPYIFGSLTFMGLFNLVGKLSPKAQQFANTNGRKMAMGVLLYGLGKNLTGDLVTRPVAMATGVDIELPYRDVVDTLPTEAGMRKKPDPQHQQKKVYDSIEFFRKDLIAHHPDYGVSYHNRIAKKLGLGTNLNDSVTETTPIIQNIVSSTKTAKSLSTYAWAAVGVGLAMQDCWNEFFDAVTNRRKHTAKPNETLSTKISERMKNFGRNTFDITKTFGKSFVKSFKTLWNGENGARGYKKHAGKGLLLFAGLLNIASVLNVICRAKKAGKLVNKELMDNTKERMVI